MYGLIKTHKVEQGLKIRPIVNSINGPTYKLTWLLFLLLQPYQTHVAAHLHSSQQLMEDIGEIREAQLCEHRYPLSLDVDSMYTSIPPRDAIEAAMEYINQHGFTNRFLRWWHIEELLTVVLSNCYIQYGQVIYKQISGLAMGSRLSGLLATLFLGRLETIGLTSCKAICYRRYVDDIFMLTTSEDEARRICDVFNTLHPNVNFTLELSKEGALSLLDFNVRIHSNQPPTFEFYRKPSRSDVWVHPHSAIPMPNKLAFIRNEKQRIQARCTNASDANRHLNAFQKRLVGIGYDNNDVSSQIRHGQRDSIRTPYAFNMQIPFVGDHFNRQLRNILTDTGLQVRLCHRSHTLRQILNPVQRQPTTICGLRNCELHNHLCLRSMVVYMVKCQTCSACYVGSTTREFHYRYREHMRRKDSAVHQHTTSSGHHQWKASVLTGGKDPVELRLLEQIKIEKLTPQLNTMGTAGYPPLSRQTSD